MHGIEQRSVLLMVTKVVTTKEGSTQAGTSAVAIVGVGTISMVKCGCSRIWVNLASFMYSRHGLGIEMRTL